MEVPMTSADAENTAKECRARANYIQLNMQTYRAYLLVEAEVYPELQALLVQPLR